MAQVKFKADFAWPQGAAQQQTTLYKTGSTYKVTAEIAEAAEAARAGTRVDDKPKTEKAKPE